MTNHLADRLAYQRNEALDREAVLYSELMEARECIAVLEERVKRLSETTPASVGPGALKAPLPAGRGSREAVALPRSDAPSPT